MDFKYFMAIIILIFIDLFVMGVCSATATNAINKYEKDLKNDGKGNSVTYSSYSTTQSIVNITVWITWVCVGAVLIGLLGYLGWHFSQKADPTKEVSDVINMDNLAEAFDLEKAQQNYNKYQSVILIGAGILLTTTTILSASSFFGYYYSSQSAKVENIKTDNTGYTAMLVGTIAGGVIVIPLVAWALFNIYRNSNKKCVESSEDMKEQKQSNQQEMIPPKKPQKSPRRSMSPNQQDMPSQRQPNFDYQQPTQQPPQQPIQQPQQQPNPPPQQPPKPLEKVNLPSELSQKPKSPTLTTEIPKPPPMQQENTKPTTPSKSAVQLV